MLTWLLVFGVGGCWSGYTDAAIIQAPDLDSAQSLGGQIAWAETAEERGYAHGCSYDVELIEGDVRDCLLYRCRCKPGAKQLAELAADGIQMYDSLKVFSAEVTHGYRRMVRLEIASTFALQGAKWLGDVAPHLLSPEEREGLADAKRRAELRVAAEARLPKHLLYTSGWPTCVPSEEEAQLIAEVRQEVARILGITVGFTTAGDVISRYQELIAARQAKAR